MEKELVKLTEDAAIHHAEVNQRIRESGSVSQAYADVIELKSDFIKCLAERMYGKAEAERIAEILNKL